MSKPSQHPKDDVCELLETGSDFEVLRMMAEADPAWSGAAQQEFYDRHKDYLWKVCSEVGENVGCNAWVEDVFHETFYTAYKKAGQFKFPECPREEEENVVQGWLGQIAQNALCSLWRKTHLERTRSEIGWDSLAEIASIPPVTGSEVSDSTPPSHDLEVLQLIDEAIATLPEREAHILRVDAQFHRLRRKAQRLPNKVVEELSAIFNTTPENLRKIRGRAKAKVRQYVEKRLGGVAS